MPSKGRTWDTTRAIHKQQAHARNDACVRCGQPIDWAAPPRTPSSYTADHITPTSHGGTDALSNLRTMHYGCNASRGDGTRGDFPTTRRW
jgi:5-methylcytosine-specific restriction endonuclease McrA